MRKLPINSTDRNVNNKKNNNLSDVSAPPTNTKAKTILKININFSLNSSRNGYMHNCSLLWFFKKE